MYLQNLKEPNLKRDDVMKNNKKEVQYRECLVQLRMLRPILRDSVVDNNSYACKVIGYFPEEDIIYLLTGKTEITSFSLDGLYECCIQTEDEEIVCQGMIRERYWCKLGRVVVFSLCNGFYVNVK